MFGAPIDQKLVPASQANKSQDQNSGCRQRYLLAAPDLGMRLRLALRKKPDAIYFLSDGELRDNTMFKLAFSGTSRSSEKTVWRRKSRFIPSPWAPIQAV